MTPPTKQQGLSLVELMIAMVIGLILMAGISQVLLSGKRSFNTQSGTGTLQENGRFAMYYLQRDIRMAGFPRSVGPTTGVPPMVAFVAANTTDGGTGGNDQIQVQFNSDPNVPNSDEDCLGQESSTVFCTGGTCPTGTNPASQTDDGTNIWIVTNHYFVQNGALMCRGIGNAAAQQIAQGVDSMQILYGRDTTGDDFADVYETATQVPADRWIDVVSVRIGLLLNSQEQVADTPDTRRYAVLDAPEFIPTDDPATPVNELLFRRQVFTTTIEVRNRTQ